MNFIKKVRENLKNPKKKSLTMLSGYVIFFVFVFILLGSVGNNTSSVNDYVKPTTQKTDINNNVTINNYEYVYIINNNEVMSQISGTFINNEDNFIYNGKSYYKKNNSVYLNSEPVTIDLDIDKYKYEKIELLIENNDSKTTFKDSNKEVYNINLNKYFSLLNESNNCNIVDCTKTNIPITIEKDIYIKSVMIDLSSYYGYKYQIDIKYNKL